MSEYTVPSRFTSAQKEAILINDNCVVSAGAGSGKTAVLSERFIRLVTEGRAHCNQILAITFTKKAASEMKSRIYSLLLERNLTEELPYFKEAAISTVDSLLSEIARTGCVKFGISPSFTIADTEDLNKMEKDLARKLLEKYKDSPLAKKMFPVISIDGLCSSFSRISQACFSFSRPFDSEKHLEHCLEVYNSSLSASHEELNNLITSYIQNLDQDSLLANNVQMLSSYMEKADPKLSHIEKAELLKEIVFDKKQGSKDSKELAKELKGGIKHIQEILVPAEESAQDVDFIKAFYDAVGDYYSMVIEKKRSMNMVTFSDVLQMSLSLLTESKSIRDIYKKRFKYIMVDEFQDNNDDYRKLIYLLSEKEEAFTEGIPKPEDITRGKIFLVGDEKQSIYRFRGADVSVFKRMQEEIELSGGRMLELETNFRTEPRLLQSFNTIFSKVMEERPGKKAFEARFRHLEDRGVSYVDPTLTIHMVERIEEDESEEPGAHLADADSSEAYQIASLIAEMVDNPKYKVCVNGVVRTATFDDFAILYRTASSQSDYEKALRLRGIPYTVEESRSQTREALVNDFYSLLQLCVYQDDPVSLSAFIGGPLSDGNSDIRDVEKGLSETDRETIETVKQILAERGLSEAISWIWESAPYRSFIISNPSNQVYEEHYLWLYTLAVDFEKSLKGPVEFLSYLRPYIGEAEGGTGKGRDVKVLRTEAYGVSLMTIHKSKGLEFPIVIVAGMGSKSGGSSSDISFTKTDENLFLPIIFTDKKLPKTLVNYFGLGTEKEEEAAELKRLFYVAATRAESHLVLSYTFKKEAENTLKNLLLYALSNAEVEVALSDILEEVHSSQIEENLLYSYGRLDLNRLEAVKPWYEDFEDYTADYSRKTIAVTSLINRPEGLSKTPLKELNSDAIIRKYGIQTDFGTFVHESIEARIKNTQSSGFKTENTEITESEIKTLITDGLALASAFLESETYRQIREENYSIESEKAFMYYDSELNTTVEGVIDLLVYNEKEARIYDFKTDSFKNPLEHKAQLEVYEKAVKSIWKEKVVSTHVLYLREFL